jgi:hypothetical protein
MGNNYADTKSYSINNWCAVRDFFQYPYTYEVMKELKQYISKNNKWYNELQGDNEEHVLRNLKLAIAEEIAMNYKGSICCTFSDIANVLRKIKYTRVEHN